MNRSLAQRLSAQTVVALCLVVLQGCAHMERADDDPCAGWRGGGVTRMTGGGLVISDYALEIPFRVRVLDVDTGAPLYGAFAVGETYYPDEEWPDETRFGTVGDDGVMEGRAWTLVGTPNPYHPCFRQRSRGVLVQVLCPGYGSYRGYVHVPPSEGERVEWGTVYLKRSGEADDR